MIISEDEPTTTLEVDNEGYLITPLTVLIPVAGMRIDDLANMLSKGMNSHVSVVIASRGCD
jgi:hypothetical protein